MLKEVETSIRGKVGLNKHVFKLDLYNSKLETGYNYFDIRIKLGTTKRPSLILETTGSFNYKNNTGYAKFTINRVNEFAKTECITNTMPNKDIFISLIRNDENGYFTFRVWVTKKVPSEPDNTIAYRCLLSTFDYDYGNDRLELISIVKGYEEPFTEEITPMIEGDRITGWILPDNSSEIGEPNRIKESDCLKVSWPENNPKYKVITKHDIYDYSIEYENWLEQHFYVSSIKAGYSTLTFPISFNGIKEYSFVCNPILSSVTEAQTSTVLIGSQDYKLESIGISIVTNLSTVNLDCHVFGPHKNPRFHDCSYLYNAKLASDDKKNLESNNTFSIYPHLLYIGKEDKYAKVS